ncbi:MULTISPECIES: serine/threonine-protein kinase [Streptomyces]|uniref:serine/threonine-protein kinase n=1 Tax=Streptomyces TaxID=1883 RepID=UPI001D037B5D|nr:MULTISPECIES: serine/threonine-protein kinase [Streptomyces]
MHPLNPHHPTRVGPYRLLGRLGAGGMGEVFLGRSPGGRLAAVKLVHGELAADAEFRRRFRREIDAARRVGGGWTAPVLDSDPDAAVPWVATGYVPGPSLTQLLREHGPLPEATVWGLAHGLVRALADIHGNGLIHRDLKPSNILITLEGPRVIDFGIVRAVDASSATRTGSMVGSPGYMAPEQIRGEDVTTAADVFALGAVLAHAATAVPPFAPDQPSLHTVLYRVLHEPPELGPETGPLAGPLRALALRCLDKEPARRPDLPWLLRAVEDRVHDPELWLPPHLTARLGREAAALLSLDGPPPTQVDPPRPEPATPPTPDAPPLPDAPPPSGTPTAPSHEPGRAGPTARGRRRALAPAATATALLLVAGVAVWAALRPDGDEPADGEATYTAEEAGGAANPEAQLHELLPEEVREAGELTVAAGIYAAPLSFEGPDGQPRGVEPDLAEAMAELLGVDLVVEPIREYNELVGRVAASHDAGPAVIGMGSLRDTAEQRSDTGGEFVNHYREGLVLLVPPGAEGTTLGDLCGGSVATWPGDDLLGVLGEANEDCGDRPFAVTTGASVAEMEQRIGAGETDAAFLPYSGARWYLDENPDSSLTLASAEQIATAPHGILLPGGQPELSDALREAVQTLIDDGTYAEILDTWNMAPLALDEATVNAGD